MNTIGKLLVILNFFFAVAVGGFLVFDFSTRAQWKRAYDDLKREADVLRARADSYVSVTGTVAAEVAAKTKAVDDLKKQLKDAEDAQAAAKAAHDAEVANYQNQLNDTKTTLQTVAGESKRLTAEVKLLTETVATREKAVNAIEGDAKKYRQEALNQENVARSLQTRIDQLVIELRAANELIAKQQTTGAAGAPGVARSPTDPNPPTPQIEGKVTRVDGMLVSLSVGSDQGIGKGNTLEVFRTRPQAKYVGMVRVTDVYPHHSVARVVPTPGRTPTPPLEGDTVASRLTR